MNLPAKIFLVMGVVISKELLIRKQRKKEAISIAEAAVPGSKFLSRKRRKGYDLIKVVSPSGEIIKIYNL